MRCGLGGGISPRITAGGGFKCRRIIAQPHVQRRLPCPCDAGPSPSRCGEWQPYSPQNMRRLKQVIDAVALSITLTATIGHCLKLGRSPIISIMLRAGYIYEQPDWPTFRWQHDELAPRLEEVSEAKKHLLTLVESLGFERRWEAVLDTITGEVLKTSEIEGEFLDPDQVRSSVAQGLGLPYVGLPRPDRDVEGIVEMLLDATQQYGSPLSTERLFGWHSALFPTGRSGMNRIVVGTWRDDSSGPMKVVSGPYGKEKVHYEAPEASKLNFEMEKFLDWFNEPTEMNLVAKAGIAHLWFVTIHPFEDGNGRIARAVADMALACSDDSAQRFYSMSAQIREDRKGYYDILERTQKGDLEVTPWMCWFVECLGRAIERSRKSVDVVLRKARIWQRLSEFDISERQKKVLNRLLDDEEEFVTVPKWVKIGRCTKDIALQDINFLEHLGVLAPMPGETKITRYGITEVQLGRQLPLLDLA